MESRFTTDQEYVVRKLIEEHEKMHVYKSREYPEGTPQAYLHQFVIWACETRINELANILQELNRKQYA